VCAIIKVMKIENLKSQFFWENILAIVIVGVFIFGGSFVFYKAGKFAFLNFKPSKFFASLVSPDKQEENTGKEKKNFEERKKDLLIAAVYPAPFIGDQNAEIEIEGFFDLLCPYTKIFFTNNILRRSREIIVRSGKTKLSFRNLPIIGGEKSQEMAMATACAGEQGRFWQMLEQLLNNQEEIKNSPLGLSGYANDINLNMNLFEYCMSDKKYEDLILQDTARAEQMEINSVPTFIINGEIVKEGLPSEQEIEKWIAN